MLSIGKLSPARAGYYLGQLPGAGDEYYTAGERGPSAWIGAAADRLDLVGEVDPVGFRRLLDGCHPGTGEGLGAPATTSSRLAGFDLCFSAPKSVSVAWALAGPEVAEQIAAAHDQAVADAVAAFEAEVVRARRGAGGRASITTDGVAAAAFGHRTSRAGDPQLHTHVVVPNLTVDATGRWSAIDGSRVYRWASTIGHLYQAALRAELTASLGAEWGPVAKGAADLAGIDRRLLEAFSTRRAQIVAALADHAATTPDAGRVAAVATRAAKDHSTDLAALRQTWIAQARELGVDAALPAGRVRPGVQPRLPADVDELLSPDGLTRQRSSFDRRDVLKALSASAPQGATVAELRAGADQVLAHDQVVALDTEASRHDHRYSTTELLAVETALIESALRRRKAGVAIVDPRIIERVIAERPSLSDEQRALLTALLRSGAGVQVVVGRAGAGKTFALDAARAAWQSQGHSVIGAALAARAAAVLQAGAGIPSVTVAQLLADLDRPGPLGGLGARSVVVIDEAGMVGTRSLARLLGHAERAGAAVVLVGDPRQLPEIDAGGAFAALAGLVPTVELADNRRQREVWERDALAELRAGSVPKAVTAYADAGRITLADSADAARQAMVTDWWDATRSGEHAVMYALRRSDVADLNTRARHQLDAAGLLGQDRLQVADHEFAVGDRVICLRNDRRLGVANGTAATIAALDPDTASVTLDTGIKLPADYLTGGHLDHGYATTIHKAQGATVDRAFLLGTDALYREAGYVGLSRARHRSDLYLVNPTPTRHHMAADPIDELTAHLTTSRAQTLAVATATQPDRHAVTRAALLADPPPWAAATLGPPPPTGADRDRWADLAAHLHSYRSANHITDPADPLGPEPADPHLRRTWERLHHATDRHVARDLDQGLHR